MSLEGLLKQGIVGYTAVYHAKLVVEFNADIQSINLMSMKIKRIKDEIIKSYNYEFMVDNTMYNQDIEIPDFISISSMVEFFISVTSIDYTDAELPKFIQDSFMDGGMKSMSIKRDLTA